jgi:hypothetical protein
MAKESKLHEKKEKMAGKMKHKAMSNLYKIGIKNKGEEEARKLSHKAFNHK